MKKFITVQFAVILQIRKYVKFVLMRAEIKESSVLLKIQKM